MNRVKGSEAPPRCRQFCQDNVHTEIFTPRDYQVEMLDAALKNNVIVCLSTGTGKTFIAAMLIKESSCQVVGDFNNGAKRTIFLVNLVALVNQQAQVIRNHTNLTVGEYIGAMNVDIWSKDVWLEEFQKYQVLVMTTQILLNILTHGFIGLSQINLLIFDECHHAVNNHPFCKIMKFYGDCPPDHYPKILGLTASILNGKINPKQLKCCIRSLELTLKSSVLTASEDIDLSKFGTKPELYFVACSDYQDTSGLLVIMKKYLEQCLTFLKDVNHSEKMFNEEGNLDHTNDYDDDRNPCSIPLGILKDVLNTVLELGPWCANYISGKLLGELENVLEMSYMNSMHRRMFLLVQTVLRVLMTLYEDYIKTSGQKDMLHLACPRIARLLNALTIFKPLVVGSSPIKEMESVNSEQNLDRKLGEEAAKSLEEESQSNLCGIVFVERRFTAYLLYQFLKEFKKHNKDFEFIECNYIVGHGTYYQTAETNMKYKKQEAVLRLFRKRELNLLIATNVIEEGIDIPKCNLVIRFDLPKEYRSYVQSKGRARASNSKFIMLVSNEHKKPFIEDLKKYITIENEILSKSHYRESLDEMDTDNNLDDEILKPYIPVRKEGGARVSLATAITLVNRYCAKLPSDIFTHLAPKCSTKEMEIGDDKLYQCCLILPINSPVRDPIWGLPMKSKRLARKAVALQACEVLHKAGELDDNLLPVGKESIKYEEEETDCEEEEPITGDAPRPGTTKRRQHYDKKIADALTDCCPSLDIPSFLYAVILRLTVPLPEEQNTRGRKIYPPEDTSRCFGILTSKEIPKIPEFPVFTRSGEVSVDLKLVTNTLIVNSEELKILEHFHNYVFSNVLQLKKQHMTFAPHQSSCSFLIIPLNKGNKNKSDLTIDWKFAAVINPIVSDKVLEPTLEQRQNFHFENAKYEDAVVMPWYRHNDQPEQYYVAEICYNLNPISQFPDEVFDTFENYYKTKYDKDIFNLSQPLLDVDRTSSRLNMLSSRHMNRKGKALPTSSDETKKAKREDLHQKQILIPELCEIHPFPASLWRKAVCLPSILYRTNSLLLAEELRVRVAIEMHIMQVNIPANFQWPPLQASWSVAVEEEKSIKESPSAKESNQAAIPTKVKTNLPVKISGPLFDNDFPIGSWDPTAVNNDYDNYNMEIGEWNNEMAVANNSCKFNEVDDPQDSLDDDDIEESWSRNFIPEDNLDGSVEILSMNGMNWKGNGFSPSFVDIASHEDIDDDFAEEMERQPLIISRGIPLLNSHCDFRVGSPTHFENGWEGDDALSWSDDSIAESGKKLHIHDVEKFINSDVNDSFDESVESSRSSSPSHQELDEADDVLTIGSLLKKKKNRNPASFFLLHKPVPKPEEEDFDDFMDGMIDIKENSSAEDILDEKRMMESFGKIAFLSQTENIPLDKQLHSAVTLKDILSADLFKNENSLPNVNHTEINGQCENPQILTHVTAFRKLSCDNLHFNTSESVICLNEKMTVKIDTIYPEKNSCVMDSIHATENKTNSSRKMVKIKFDDQVDLDSHVGPSPSTILQAFTMSNANDIFNLERLETIGDSFLKHAVTTNLYLSYSKIHEGKLSFLRSKQVSNLNLYRLGKKKNLGLCMAANKFEPSDNWLPPGYLVSKDLALLPGIMGLEPEPAPVPELDCKPYIIPYNLLTQHSIPDKSIADCVEALIGAYLISCGSQGALLFMSWLGLKVLRKTSKDAVDRQIESTTEKDLNFRYWDRPNSPLLDVPDAKIQLEHHLENLIKFEDKIGYHFIDKAYLLQAFTHASYHHNKITDCYQRLEFLGDAVLDYLITRYLYEDAHDRSPGELTDLRSALVNNTIFASLAVKYDFHKFFNYLSAPLFLIIGKFVKLQKERNNSINEEDVYGYFNCDDDDNEEAEDVEAPKALGDIFESVAGAIYLDSGMSLDAVWQVYFEMMHEQIERFSTNVPKSPIRELLEMEPETAKFGKPERKLDGKVRVTVEVIGKGKFVGVGRNYNIAKCTAAKRALKHLKKVR